MYEVMYRNHSVFKIEIEGRQKGIVQICDEKYLPFDIWLDEGDDIDIRLHNLTNFNTWAIDRLFNLGEEFFEDIPNYLKQIEKYNDIKKTKIAIATRCLSLDDCYWVKDSNENLLWEDFNLASVKKAVTEQFRVGKI